MKKILLIISLILCSSSFVYADAKKCDGLKKLSKKYFKCNTKNIKEDTIKKYKNIKNTTSKKTESLKLEVKTFGSKIKNKLKKKE